MSTVSALHSGIAWFVIIIGGVAGTWAVAAHWSETLRHRFLWLVQHVFHVLVAIQVALGALVVGFSDVEPGQDHMLYGFLTFAGVGLIIGYRGQIRYRYLVYGLGGLFVMGLAIRAMLLDPIASQ